MCTILVAWRAVPGASLAIAANRDELLDRPSAPPGILVETPRIAGGRDLLAGGTWLAVTPTGRVAAVTNRHAEWRDPARRSRGELPLLALELDEGEASAWLRGIDAAAYNPANVLVASPRGACVAHLDGDGPSIVELRAGVHVLTTGDVDQPGEAKVAHLAGLLGELVAGRPDPPGLLAGMEEVLRDHGPAGRAEPGAACIHGDVYGTVSASSVLVGEDGVVLYRHAQGRPCVTAFEDVGTVLR